MSEHIEAEHALECYFCYVRAKDFRELAEHVNEAHISETERMKREYTRANREYEEAKSGWAGNSPGTRIRGRL